MSDQPAKKPRYIWRVQTVHPERYGTRCHILGDPNVRMVTVEFEDGESVIAHRSFVRLARPGE